ncbi:hypothetical protein CDO23_07045 [Sinorhizobium meliloti]|nr:hypothetical protein CDO23_07045 [Sinorhizobium meliloti]
MIGYDQRKHALQRRASYQTRKGRCSALICCMFLNFDRLRSKETCSRLAVARGVAGVFFSRREGGRPKRGAALERRM